MTRFFPSPQGVPLVTGSRRSSDETSPLFVSSRSNSGGFFGNNAERAYIAAFKGYHTTKSHRAKVRLYDACHARLAAQLADAKGGL